MAKIVCTKCGKTGCSKCPFCRSIFGDEDTRTDMIDGIMSHRLMISDKGILLKRWSITRNEDNSIGGPETDFDILKSVVRLLKDLTDDELRVIACAHSWDFAPFAKSDIECGHSSEYKPLLDYMADAWSYLSDGVDQETSKYPHGDAGDLEAAEIIDRALDAVDKGVEFTYVKKGEAK